MDTDDVGRGRCGRRRRHDRDIVVTVVEDTGRHLHLAVHGEIDLISARSLVTIVDLAIDGANQVILDLAGVSFMDSQGISALVLIARVARDHGSELVLTGARPTVARLLEVTGVDRVVGLSVVTASC